jgi:hypothetical protein
METRTMRDKLKQHQLAVAAAALLLTACVKSELEVPDDHPGSPDANPGQVAPSTALRKEPALAENSAPAASPHAGHERHSETPAPVASEATQPQSSAPSQQAPDTTTYVCPMHPEVVRKEPGECPICGMNLVPKKATK